MRNEDLLNENFEVPGRLNAEDLRKSVAKSRFGRRGSRMGGSRADSQNSIAVRSRRGSRVSGSKVSGDIGANKDNGGLVRVNSITIEDMNSSRMSEGRNSLASNTIFPPTENLGFNIMKDVSSRMTRHNIDPERQWAKKFSNEVKPIYNPE